MNINILIADNEDIELALSKSRNSYDRFSELLELKEQLEKYIKLFSREFYYDLPSLKSKNDKFFKVYPLVHGFLLEFKNELISGDISELENARLDKLESLKELKVNVNAIIKSLKERIKQEESIKDHQRNTEKITWQKNIQDLVYLFELLKNFGFIPDYSRNKDEIIRSHFNLLSGEIRPNTLKHHRINLLSPEKNVTHKPSSEIKIIENELTKVVNGSR